MRIANRCYIVVGGRKISHLHDNIKALEIQLTPEHIKSLEEVVPFDIGFPATAFGTNPHYDGGANPNGLVKASAHMQWVKEYVPIPGQKPPQE